MGNCNILTILSISCDNEIKREFNRLAVKSKSKTKGQFLKELLYIYNKYKG